MRFSRCFASGRQARLGRFQCTEVKRDHGRPGSSVEAAARQSARIIASAELYKECEQCRSIVLKKFGLCPWCHCYRFFEDAERIRATAREMDERPFSMGEPVVPRLELPSGGTGVKIGKSTERLYFQEINTRKNPK
jgi:hypothetical protein